MVTRDQKVYGSGGDISAQLFGSNTDGSGSIPKIFNFRKNSEDAQRQATLDGQLTRQFYILRVLSGRFGNTNIGSIES
ncbi:hypothetical protein HDU67_005030, partial [Dinochytrium kinnereticum]